jgi:hypothetical protein
MCEKLPTIIANHSTPYFESQDWDCHSSP